MKEGMVFKANQTIFNVKINEWMNDYI
jgi:hypothetical protein